MLHHTLVHNELTKKGKTLGKIDMQYKKQAEEMLHEELSIVLNIPYEDIPGYIRRQVEVTA